jgi:predicted TIM-barrel fold metal-dependent hydrolase
MSSAPTPGAWDCHAHLFGPYAKYPLAAERSYTPPEAPMEAYDALLARLGFAHGVLVHPSAYGEDFSLLFDALAARPNLRGVVVAQAHAAGRLKGLRERGVRALRFSHRTGAGANFAGSASWDDLIKLAPLLADLGLHAELWTDRQALPAIAPALLKLPVPVVLDHMGGFDVEAGLDEPGFRSLIALLEEGKVWVKMCAYRNLLKTELERGRPFHQRMLAANPRQLVWGSDWPHLRVEPVPDALHLLKVMREWTGDAALAHAILVDNPARLYT